MSNSESHIDPRVSDYVKGKLSAEECASFEAELALSETLQEQVAHEKMAFEFFVDLDVIDLKRVMEADLASPNKATRSNKYWRLIMLFGAGMMCLIAWRYWPLNKPLEVEEEVVSVTLTEEIAEEKINDKEPELKEAVVQEKIKEAINRTEPLSGSFEVEELEAEVEDEIDLEMAEGHLKEVVVSNNVEPEVIALEEERLTEATNKFDPCLNISFTGNVETKPSVVGMETGEVLIESARIKGGVGPYLFSLRRFNSEDEIHRFDDLASGTYILSVIDGNNCEGELQEEVMIKETYCSNNYQPTFNASYQSEWKVPIAEGQSAHVTLVNRVGQILIDQNMNSNARGIWNGILDNGLPAAPGAYKWFLSYDNGEKCIVNLTVLN